MPLEAYFVTIVLISHSVVRSTSLAGLQHWGGSPTLLREVLWDLKVTRIGLVEVGRLGQWLNVPTQGRRVAQTGDVRPFSLTVLGS